MCLVDLGHKIDLIDRIKRGVNADEFEDGELEGMYVFGG